MRFLFISQASVQPFKVGVHFSNDEYASANLNMFALAKVDTMYNDGEFLKAPGGIIGMYCKRLITLGVLHKLSIIYLGWLMYIFVCFSGFSLCYTTGAPTAG